MDEELKAFFADVARLRQLFDKAESLAVPDQSQALRKVLAQAVLNFHHLRQVHASQLAEQFANDLQASLDKLSA